ncbi:MAG: LysE family translocator [Thermoplasmata archaeon]
MRVGPILGDERSAGRHDKILSEGSHDPHGGSREAYTYTFLLGVALGFSLTIPPGPMNALIAYQTVHSLRRGILTGFGGMTADLVLLLLVYALRSIVDLGSLLRFVYLIGGAVLFFFGVRVLLRPPEPVTVETSGVRTYSQAVVVGVSNPFQIVWWLTAGLAFAYLGGIVLFVGLFAAVTVWVVGFPYALHLGTRRHPEAARAVVYVSSALLFAFAAYFVFLAL